MSKLNILILNSEESILNDPDIYPTLIDNDVTLLCVPSTEPDTFPTVKIHISGKQRDFDSKKKTSAIMDRGVELTSDFYDIMTQASKTIQVWSSVQDHNVADTVTDLFTMMEEVFPSKDFDLTWMNEVYNLYYGGGNYRGAITDDDGLMVETEFHPARAGLPKTKKRKRGEDDDDDDVDPSAKNSVWSPSNADQVIALIKHIDPLIKYEGYVPDYTRDTYKEARESEMAFVKGLMLCFAAYIHIANNIGNLVKRRVDVKTGQKLIEAVETLGVKKTDRTKEGLTLPRLAMCYMAEYLAFRKFMTKDLQSQTTSDLNVLYKDLAFYGCPEIRSMTGYDVFHKELSCCVYHKDVSGDIEDKKFLKSYARWNRVAENGYRSDVKIHERVKKIIGTNEMSPENCYKFIAQAMTEYNPAAEEAEET